MPMSNFPNGFSGGVAIRGMPILNTHSGNVFWVDSGSGSNGNNGTYGQPFATVDYTIGRCTASNGDTIMVAPGHVETIAAAGGVTVDVAGVTIIGLGNGASRPTFNFTATASTYIVTAADHVVSNCLFTGGIDAVVTMFTISGADCAILNCETRDVTGQMTSCITTATGADRLLIDGYTHRGAAAAGGVNCLELVGADDGVTVRNFWIDGNFSTAAIQNVTGVMTNLSIYGDQQCFLRTRNAADVAITLVATSTGNLGPNINMRLQDNAANIDECIVGAAMNYYLPLNVVNLQNEYPFGTTAVGGIGIPGAARAASTDA